MSEYRFSSVAQLEQHMDSKIKKNHTLFTVEFKCKVIASYLNKQKPDIPLRHKKNVFFEKLTGILTASKSGFSWNKPAAAQVDTTAASATLTSSTSFSSVCII